MDRKRICELSKNILWNVFELIKSKVFNLSKQSNNDDNKSANCITTVQNDTRPIIIIPAGTQLCPMNRHDSDENINPEETYYIIINKSIEVRLDTLFTVIINGVTFNIINPKTRNTDNLKNSVSSSVVIPKDTPYYVSDANKDSIGLTHLLKTDERFRIRPGSYIYLLDNTELVMCDVKDNIVFVDVVRLIVEGQTKCMV